MADLSTPIDPEHVMISCGTAGNGNAAAHVYIAWRPMAQLHPVRTKTLHPFDWDLVPAPEHVAWPLYPHGSPARSNQESRQSFNEIAARQAFGNACIDWLQRMQEFAMVGGNEFRGDWWQLALLYRYQSIPFHTDPNHYVGTLDNRNRNRVFTDLSYQKVHTHLEGAGLMGCDLCYMDFRCAHLQGADLGRSNLRGSYLCGAHMRGAYLSGAMLDSAAVFWSDLTEARVAGASLQKCDLNRTCFDRAILDDSDFHSANLEGSTFEHTSLRNTCLDLALMRRVTHVLFNDTRVKRLDIEGTAPDPWSSLRRTYTGPMFFVHLLLLVAFLLPYAAKVLTLTTTARGYEALRESLEAGEGVPPGGEVVRAWLEHFDASHTQTHAAWVLLGGTHAWWWAMVPTALAILCYNVLRGHLTLTIGVLRDQADRVERTPTLAEYYGQCHPLAGDDAGVRRIPAVWRRRFAEWRKAERRWKNLGLLNPLPVIGPWRLHQLARVLFWISIASVVLHVGAWLWTTTVPVPK